jgi:transcriptional regulator with XRE-family HTH domain
LSENETVVCDLYLLSAIVELIMSRYNYNRIKEFLAKKGKKNIDLAKSLKVDPRTVSSWCGNKSQPEYETLFKVSVFLDVEAGDLLTLRKDLRVITDKSKNKVIIKSKAKKHSK